MRFAFFILVFSIACGAAPVFRVLPPMDGGQLSASGAAINNSGIVAGHGRAPSNSEFGVLWADGAVFLDSNAQAAAVNESGAVVGTRWVAGTPQATLWTGAGNAAVTLGAGSYGLGINDAGEVAGSTARNGRTTAFVGSAGTLTFLDAPGNWSVAYDVNNAGQAVGTYMTSAGGFAAFSWTASRGAQALGSLGGGNSYAMTLNDRGQIAGSSLTGSGYLHAFLYDAAMRDLGTLGGSLSAAYGINAAGQVVGYSEDGAGRQHAFIWMNGAMFDLNDWMDGAAGYVLESAYGINDRGQVTGTAVRGILRTAYIFDVSDQLRALGDPGASDEPASPVPEPSTGFAVTAAFGLLWILARARL